MKIGKILWPNDGSRESEIALEYAKYFAEIHNAEIEGLFVNIVDYPFVFYHIFYDEYVINEAHRKVKEFSNKFKKLAVQLKNKKIKLKGMVLRGNPDEVINRVSEVDKIDLIVMGITGRNFIDRMIIGSTTLKVLRKSKVPVLVIKSQSKNIKFNKILVPVDLSDNLETNLIFALEHAQKNNCHVTVLYVVKGINNRDILSQSIVKELVGGGEQVLKKTVNGIIKKIPYGSTGLKKIKTRVIFANNVPWSITDYARRNSFDLISINSNNKNILKRLFIGSVAEEVIRKSACNIIAFKP